MACTVFALKPLVLQKMSVSVARPLSVSCTQDCLILASTPHILVMQPCIFRRCSNFMFVYNVYLDIWECFLWRTCFSHIETYRSSSSFLNRKFNFNPWIKLKFIIKLKLCWMFFDSWFPLLPETAQSELRWSCCRPWTASPPPSCCSPPWPHRWSWSTWPSWGTCHWSTK